MRSGKEPLDINAALDLLLRDDLLRNGGGGAHMLIGAVAAADARTLLDGVPNISRGAVAAAEADRRVRRRPEGWPPRRRCPPLPFLVRRRGAAGPTARGC